MCVCVCVTMDDASEKMMHRHPPNSGKKYAYLRRGRNQRILMIEEEWEMAEKRGKTVAKWR